MEPDSNICKLLPFSSGKNKQTVNASNLTMFTPSLSGLKSRLGDPLDQSISASSACFTALPNCEVIFVCGFWDNSFKCFASNSGILVVMSHSLSVYIIIFLLTDIKNTCMCVCTGDMIQTVFGHRGIVTCVNFSHEDGLHGNKGNGLIGTGSQDTTVLLWKWSGRQNRVIGPLSESQGN